MSEKLTLVKKLAKVMQEVKYIQKKGYNKFHGYKYATEADVAEKVREVLAEQNVVMIANTTSHNVREHINQKGNREYIVTVNVEFRFIDGDTGETIVFNMAGEGQDAGDKGTYKAITGAQKYALMKTFMIPTGDDPEADDGVDNRNNASEPEANSKQDGKRTVNDPKIATLKAKWQTGKGTIDGFDDWYKQQKQAGYTEVQMDAFLTKALKRKGEESA